MIFQFFHDKVKGDEWFIFNQLSNGCYLALCTRQTDVYKLGCIKKFYFDDPAIWSKGKYRLKPKNHSLTNKNKQNGKPRDANR